MSKVIGVGIDVVEIDRFRKVVDRRPNIVNRLFTSLERDYTAGFKDPVPRLAARFAAKEAVMKALGMGIGSCKFTDIEISNAPSGAPAVSLTGEAGVQSDKQGVVSWLVSMTHGEIVAEALALAQ